MNLHPLTVAFAEACDRAGLTYEAGIRSAETLADEFMGAAEDRDYAPREERSDEGS